MGYSKNPNVLNRVANHIRELQQANGTKDIEWKHDDPAKLALWLREAMGPELKAIYVVKVRVGSVLAQPRVYRPIESASIVRLPGLREPLEIIGACIHHGAAVIHFPDGEGSIPIHRWGTSNGYYLVVNEEGLTMTKTDPGEIAWRPDDTL